MGEQKEIQEVKNAYGAYAQISVINPYDIEELKRIHAIMTKYLVDESGCFRHGEEGVFNGEQCIFMALPARLVPQLIDELFAWMNRVQGEVHLLILASVFHYEFVFIHPFSDGNGRMARLWHTCLLSKWKSVFQYIPIESQIEKFQDEYYNAIVKCHINGDSNVFIEFMLKQIDKILETIASLNEINPLTTRLIQIARDGKISDDEIKDFAFISNKLDEISLAIDSLNLWVDKTAGEQGLNIELLREEKKKQK